MSAKKVDYYKWLTANDLNRISKNSLFRKINRYHSTAEERAKRLEEDKALGYPQIVKAFSQADKRIDILKDKQKNLENDKKSALNSEYDEAVERGLIKLYDGCKELWVSTQFVEWMHSDEDYLRVKDELSDAMNSYNRYLALEVKWEKENADIIKAERIRTKREELLQADPETLRALGIEPETIVATNTNSNTDEDDGKNDLRSALRIIHPSASDTEIEGMLKSHEG